MRRGETEVPEDQLGEIMLLEPTGAPGESWMFSCRMSDNIVKAFGQNAGCDGDTPSTVRRRCIRQPRSQWRAFNFNLDVRITHIFQKKKLVLVSRKMHVQFRIIVDNRPVWSRPYGISSEQWKCLRPTDEMVIGSRWLQ